MIYAHCTIVLFQEYVCIHCDDCEYHYESTELMSLYNYVLFLLYNFAGTFHRFNAKEPTGCYLYFTRPPFVCLCVHFHFLCEYILHVCYVIFTLLTDSFEDETVSMLTSALI